MNLDTKSTSPKILYKYRDWNNSFHKKVLLDCSVYLASPKDFEDNFDCNAPEKFPAKSELYDFFLKGFKNHNPYRTIQWCKKLAKHWSIHSPLASPYKLKKKREHAHQELNERFGVLSLTANCDNGQMWKKYSNEHKGFCIGFDANLLLECVAGGWGQVKYVDDLPIIDFEKDDIETKHVKNTFYKKMEWEFEQEYRVHKTWKILAATNERNIKLPNECIVEILLGKSMPQEDKDEIKIIAEGKYPTAKVMEC